MFNQKNSEVKNQLQLSRDDEREAGMKKPPGWWSFRVVRYYAFLEYASPHVK
jgi:hypothetical protein